MNTFSPYQFDVYLNKKKPFRMLLLGLFLLIFPIRSLFAPDNGFDLAVAIFFAVLFGTGVIAAVSALLTNGPLLRVDARGSFVKRYGLIPWAEITGFRIITAPVNPTPLDMAAMRLASSKLFAKNGAPGTAKALMIDIKEPEQFISSVTPKWRQQLLRGLNKKCGSPILIADTAVNIRLEDLLTKLNETLAFYKKL
jgi:hypothetical protein